MFMQSCCMMSPATLIPTPVQRIANSRGIREMRKTFHCSKSPEKRPGMFTSITPTNKDGNGKGDQQAPQYNGHSIFYDRNHLFVG